METKELLRSARMKLYDTQPFFSYLMMFLKPQRKDEVQTMGIDIKGNLYYNEAFTQAQTNEALQAIITHETMHAALQHFQRFVNKQRDVANISQDLAINEMLQNNGFNMEWEDKDGKPLQTLIPEKHTFTFQGIKIEDIDKKDAEAIYRELMHKLPKQYMSIGKGNGKGDGKGEGQLPEGFDKHDYEGAEEEQGEGKESKSKGKSKGIDWNEKLVTAATIAKQQGKLPAGMDRLINQLLTPKIKWREKLKKYITREIPCNFSYSKPHKKSITAGYYMPDFTREKVEITVAIDTSGSIGMEELTEFTSELIGIAKSFEQIKMTVLVADSAVHASYPVENGSIQKIRELKMIGGGGTNHAILEPYIKEHLPQTKCLICFSDGYTDFGETPFYNVLWVISKGGVEEKDVPYGEAIKLE